MIGNLSGLKAVVFLRRFGPLLCDARAINDIVKLRKAQTRLKRTQFALRLHRKDEDNCAKK